MRPAPPDLRKFADRAFHMQNAFRVLFSKRLCVADSDSCLGPVEHNLEPTALRLAVLIDGQDLQVQVSRRRVAA